MKRARLPAFGLIGEAALREAAAGSYQLLMEQISAALRIVFQLDGGGDVWPYVRALFPDSVVVDRNGRLWRYPYTVGTDGVVTLGDSVEVVETFADKAGPAREALGAAGDVFVEAIGDNGAKGSKWRIRVIRSGLSGNNNYYSDAALREAVPLFDGVRVFAKSDEEHLAGKGKDVRNLIGAISNPVFIEGKRTDCGEIQADFTLLQPNGDIGVKLLEAWDRGMSSLFGFSIDATAVVKAGTHGGRAIREATRFRKVASVDLIVEPGAGGQLVNLIEAKQEEDADMALRHKIIATIEARRPELLKGKDVAALSDDQLDGIFTEALSGQQADVITRTELDSTMRLVEARDAMRRRIEASSLPPKAKDRLRLRFETAAEFTEAQVVEAIKEELEYIGGFTESGTVRGLGDFSRIETGETRAEKVAAMLDAFFDPNHKDHQHATSFKECYVDITGDRRVTGIRRNCDEGRMRESLNSASFDDVLGDAITRRMVADYRQQSNYDVWRSIATVVPVTDFRTQERTRFGGYGDLPAVAQADPYASLDSPEDEKATYAVTKRGGTEDVTLEMIKNDDVGAISRIPVKLSRAAKRTLGKFVLDFIRVNPVIYDGTALFHADHNNLGSVALGATSIKAGRTAILEQTEDGSGDRLGIPPKSLLVPFELEDVGSDLFRRNTNLDATFIQSLSLQVVPVWYWTDATDWALAADPMDIPTIEVGFLDGNQEPELFVQDSPTNGSMFTHDKLTWKIRHIYGGNVIDYRGLYKAVVAG